MRIPRIYTPQNLTENTTVELDDAAANHVSRVLRMKTGRKLFLFNGEGEFHFESEVISSERKGVKVKLLKTITTHLESPLHIHLGQAISKGEHMEFAIQKAVELGVNEITPLWTEHCDVKLNTERLQKKIMQWNKIAVAACEQSGRNVLPKINEPQKLAPWLNSAQADEKWVLDPRAAMQNNDAKEVRSACLLIGPEGGLSEEEVKLACLQNFKAKLIGPRILRTETAALTAICLMQNLWGDF